MQSELSTDAEVLMRLVETRWSCRGFRPEPVPHRVIEQILAIAARSPSWCNTQPWKVIVTEGDGTDRFRSALWKEASSRPTGLDTRPDFAFPDRYEGIYQERRRSCGFALYESVGVARGDRSASTAEAMKNYRLFEAPHAAIITTEADLGPYGAIDCGIYVANFLLAAQSLGVGAVPQAALATYAPFLRQYFGLPASRLVVCGISFGLPDEQHPANKFRTTRARPDETLTWFR